MTSKKLTLREIWESYGLPESRRVNSKKHISEMHRHLSRWESSAGKKRQASKIKRHHLEEWRNQLLDSGLSPRSANKHLATIRRVLIVAEDNGIIKRRPRIPMLQESSQKTKLFLRDEQLDAMFETACDLVWPFGNSVAPTFWRCAIILYRNYGFRTQELLAYESSKKPITWKNICFSCESPDTDSMETCKHGWLTYTPPKTAKKKPTPIVLPLTRYTRAAIDRMLEFKTSDTDSIFKNPRHQQRFFEVWNGWLAASEVKPRNESEHYQPRHLRKTAATYLNQHQAGLASAVCRWGSTGEAAVASAHYISNELLLQKLHTAPMPASFDWVLPQAATLPPTIPIPLTP